MKYLLFLFIIIFCRNSVAQNYYGISPKESTKLISPEDNQIDWSVCGVENSIPNYLNKIDVTTKGARGDSIFDNSKIIQNLINSSNFGTVLLFPSGTYLFNTSINLKSGIVIRGASSSETILKFDLNGTAKPSFWFSSWDRSSTTPIISGYNKGSITITVQDPTLFYKKDYIEIFQDNDPSLMYTKEEWNVSWAEESVGQMARIININGNKMNIAYPLDYNFSPTLNIRARSCKMLTDAGIENFKLIRIDKGEEYSIRMDYAANCWIRNIESAYSQKGHIQLIRSLNIEIRESYLHHAYNYGGGGHGYGINIAVHSTGCLVENNIFYHLRHSFLAKEGAIGNVFAYNYSLEPNGNRNDIAMHGHYGLMNLFEGNIVQKIAIGDFWGPSGPGNTFFRNRIEDNDIVIQDQSHYQNVIGNEFLNGSINISDNTHETWTVNNQNREGFLDKKNGVRTPNSLYLKTKPKFFKSLPWPAVGPEFNLGQYTIPAEIRWNKNDQLVPTIDFNYN
ncbi:glycosyl hydrolase family 28-related protein [Flavimarina sp. Hel_I_48]|uniref:glycosyl hydrolase family 28-related protein n=1 Tax=Flavimarina sp. Hel_I_48 TaxID=1392488 RepID=UPI000691D88B|nr:glycosyl hydrolase family 28-related protein [Flavimarina sp. Hel_I_48]